MAKVVTENRKARFDYFIEDKFEAGLELLGWEVKSARAASVNLADSFVFVKDGSAWLKNAHFSPFAFGDVKTQETRRDRRLLLNKSEINKIHKGVKSGGYTCVATKIYLTKRGLVKVEIALAKGKKNYDKRATEKERAIIKEIRSTTNVI